MAEASHINITKCEDIKVLLESITKERRRRESKRGKEENFKYKKEGASKARLISVILAKLVYRK